MNEMFVFSHTTGKTTVVNPSNTSISIKCVLSGIRSQQLKSTSMVAAMAFFVSQATVGKNVNFIQITLRHAVVRH